MTANGSSLLPYAMIISVQKLTRVIKSNTAGFLRIQTQQENTIENTKKDHWNKMGLIKKYFLINTNEDIGLFQKKKTGGGGGGLDMEFPGVSKK